MRAGSNLDQLCKTISDLCCGKSAEEGEIQEGVDWCVVSTESVLVVAVVDGYLDGNRCIDQTDDCGWDTNEVGVTAVCSTCKAGSKSALQIKNLFVTNSPCDVSHETASNDKNRFLVKRLTPVHMERTSQRPEYKLCDRFQNQSWNLQYSGESAWSWPSLRSWSYE